MSEAAMKCLFEIVLIEVIDLMTLLDPELEMDDENRTSIYDQLRTNLDVLRWFKLDISDYEEQLQVTKTITN